MKTSKVTDQNHIQQKLFAGDFLANQSQTRASAKGSQRLHSLVCGTNSIESFAYYDRDTSSWKTCQQSFLEDLESFSETWPRQGITVNGVAYQRHILEPVTKEIDGGQFVTLPTPLASDPERKAKFKQGGTPLLGDLLPTPRATSAITENLKTVKRRGRNKGNLEEVIALLPTPTARDYKDSGEKVNYKKAAKKGKLAGVMVESRSDQTGKNFYLNALFVEEMMGYPVGWTELKD